MNFFGFFNIVSPLNTIIIDCIFINFFFIVEGPTNQNISGLSPPHIHASANQSVTSKAVAEAISFVPSIIGSLFVVLSLMA